jgi:hypothetical protein
LGFCNNSANCLKHALLEHNMLPSTRHCWLWTAAKAPVCVATTGWHLPLCSCGKLLDVLMNFLYRLRA